MKKMTTREYNEMLRNTLTESNEQIIIHTTNYEDEFDKHQDFDEDLDDLYDMSEEDNRTMLEDWKSRNENLYRKAFNTRR